MTTKSAKMAQARNARRAARKTAPMTAQRAMQGPYVAPEGTHGAGVTNAEALAVIVEVLGSSPVVGDLYRVGLVQGAEGHKVKFIGEYRGLALDQGLDAKGRVALLEPVLLFVIRNPVLPEEDS